MKANEFNLRLFFAISLPDAAREEVAGLIAPLKKIFTHPHNRWVKPENYHITLQFLPAVDPLEITRLIDKTRATTAAFEPFEVTLEPLEFFPSHRIEPKMITLGTKPQLQLAALAKKIGHGMQDTGYPPTERLFRGHVTLCRLHHEERQHPKTLPALPLTLPSFKAQRVILYRSEKLASDYEYTVMDTFHAKNV